MLRSGINLADGIRLWGESLCALILLSIAKKLRTRAYQIGTPVPFIRIKEYNHVISVHQSIMVVKTSTLIHRAHRALLSRKMEVVKMIQVVLQGEIGGKGLFTIRSFLGQGIHSKMSRPILLVFSRTRVGKMLTKHGLIVC
ncbi:hypothetical protein PanWU01x14_156600 [Parasponia andersonii]|uniref:Uncharacterized protein n=1 Tax=Parasponia andersonii TaxID=3476 RepID=A0A2P5CFW0_PARAD|nr:hypothetical protein PanWU01x14_156600 [Parasponia andersonii]